MEDVVKLITDNGIGIVCVAYLIYFQVTTMRDITNVLNAIKETLAKTEVRLQNIEEKIEEK